MPHKFRRLDDAQWNMIADMLKAAGGNLSRNTRDHIDGILFLMQFDLPWRSLDPEFGKWNSVYVRFTRWAEKGVLDQLVVAFKRLGLTGRWNTEWIEYSRSHGAKAAPTLREIVAKNVVEGSVASVKDDVAAAEKHNFSKAKAARRKPKPSPGTSIVEKPVECAAEKVEAIRKSRRSSSQQNNMLLAMRERRRRRRQANLRLL